MRKALCISLIAVMVTINCGVGGSTLPKQETVLMAKEVAPRTRSMETEVSDEQKSINGEYIRLERNILSELTSEINKINRELEENFVKIINEEQQRKAIRLEKEKEEISSVNFNPYNLLERSNMSLDMIYYVLPDCMKYLAGAFYDAEQNYGVNAIFLISLVREESGNNTSYNAEVLNNMGGVKNSDGSYRYFDSQYECIDYIGRLIKKHYLTPNQIIDGEEYGLYYNGTSIWNVNIMYCEGTQWAENLIEIAYETLDKAKEY